MNPVQRTILVVSAFIMALVLGRGVVHAGEKPEIVRLDAHYAASVIKISVHWQSANPVTFVKAVVGGEARELRVDPYDNRRNPDGYSGTAEILVNASPAPGRGGIPYVVQIEDDLRRKSEQVTGTVKTPAGGTAGEGSAGRGAGSYGPGMSGTDFQTDAGTQRALQAIQDQWSGTGQGPPADTSDTSPVDSPGGVGLDDDGQGLNGAGYGPDGGVVDSSGQSGTSDARILRNDTGSVDGFLPLGPGDAVAVYLENQGEPFTVEKVHFAFGGSPDTVFLTMRILEGTGTPGNLKQRYSARLEVPPMNRDVLVLDLASYGIAVPIRTGNVWVSLEMEHDGFPGVGCDTKSTAVPGRNWVRLGGSWSNFESFEVLQYANAVIRVEISGYQATQEPQDSRQGEAADRDFSSDKPAKAPPEDTAGTSRNRPNGDAGSSGSGALLPGTSSGRTPLSPSDRTVEWSETKDPTVRDLSTSGTRDAALSGGLLSGKDPITRVSPPVTSSMTVSTKGERGSADVTGFTPTTVTLTRGGEARKVDVHGSGLQNAITHVVKGGTVVRDVTARIQSTPEKTWQVILEAPPSETGSGRDYVLQIVAGGEVVGQMVFAVVDSKDPVSVRPGAPIRTVPDGILRK